MCIPDPTIAIAVVSAVSSAITSITGYAQEQSNYQAQMVAYRESQRAYQEQINNNARAANRAYESEQRKLKAAYDQAAVEAQQRQVQAMKQQGTILASGRQGQSIGTLMSDAERAYGRDLATVGMNLGYAQQDYLLGAESVFLDATTANNAAASQRRLKPTRPSPLGLIGGLAQAGLGAYSSYQQLQAPRAGSNTGGNNTGAKRPNTAPTTSN